MSKDEIIQAILEKLVKGQRGKPDKEDEKWRLCPFCGDDQIASNFSFNVKKGTFKCFACDEKGGYKKLAEQLGIKIKAEKAKTESLHLTLEEYADYKKIPIAFLQGWGLETSKYKQQSKVKIPYFDEAGNLAGINYRLCLAKGDETDNRFRWRHGDKVLLYGLWRLARTRKDGYVILVEGESDCHTLWFYDLPAIGVPGGSNWKAEWAESFKDIDVYVWSEPDKTGQEFFESIGQSLPEAKKLTPPEGRKDISECHLLGDNIFELLDRLKAEAVSYEDIKKEEQAKVAREAMAAAGELLYEKDILSKVSKTLESLGLVGEENNAKLLYLALTSRLLLKPISIAVKGQSSGGKSNLVEKVLMLFPETAYYTQSSMSEKALIYMSEPLIHRFLVLYEAAGMTSPFADYILRSLLSEGHIKYTTVEKNDKLDPPIDGREVNKPGPTGLIVTTTKTALFWENETRMFSINITDSSEHTKEILRALAKEDNDKSNNLPDLKPWIALQEYLSHIPLPRVYIPYANDIAEMADSRAVRLRRDFKAVLNLIRIHTILHQFKREKDEDDRLIATMADYETVWNLVINVLNQGVQTGVSEETKETVIAVEMLLEEEKSNDPKPDGEKPDKNPKTITVAQLCSELGLDRSTVWRRARVAVQEGYLKNLAKRRQPYQLTMGDPLPEEVNIIPSPDDLKAYRKDGSRPENGTSPDLDPELVKTFTGER